uniref:Stress-response A/B barrel domain-containing protein n=4 Tax=Aegilops tauschii subsp. strangulata TaxID=200361 RepID=A0A453N669_AEGTS
YLTPLKESLLPLPLYAVTPCRRSHIRRQPRLAPATPPTARCVEKREIQHASMPWTLDERRPRRPVGQNKQGATMAVAERSGGGVVKHLLIVQFKEAVTPERLDGLIRGYAGLVDKVLFMKAFH